jgi:hypothetical protein
VSEREETNEDRINAIQRLLPPAAGVKTRLGYASLDELARLVGTNRSHVIAWKKGTEPSRKHREKLAELSGGRYQADDFIVRPVTLLAARSAALSLDGLAQALRLVEDALDRLTAATADNDERLAVLERLLEQRGARHTRQGARR